jgi:predicted AlkP superfamily phosphohydrolase/phosphomutase
MQDTGTSSSRKLLLIGLDAADRELVEQWSDQGHLPNLARLKSTGVWGDLETTADTVHVSAWPSIFSGVTPDKHGLYHAYVMREGEQAPVRPRPEECPVPFVWKLLDDHGKKSIVMDAFLTCPLRNFGGIQIVDWGSWTWFSGQEIQPKSIKDEIRRRFGPYPAENHSKVGMTPPPDPRGFRERLIQGVETKTEVASWLLETQPWDFFLVVFGECHAAGHYFWHYQDEDYVAYPEDCDDLLRSALLDIYKSLDQAIGDLIAKAGSDTDFVIVSGDGMGPNYSASHLLPDVLKRLRMMNAGGDEGEAEKADTSADRQSLASRLRNLVPKSARALVSKYILPRAINEKLSLHWKTADIDWSNTRAFLIDNANEGYIRINLKGREPQGIVDSGADYDEICQVLHDAASRMANPSTGRRAASTVHKTVDIYSGPCVHNMPDVIINWDPEAQVTTTVEIEGLGVIESPDAGYQVSPYYTGNHRGNAFVITGRAGTTNPTDFVDGSILDLAPTILDYFNIAIPSHMDGRSRSELLDGQAGSE